MCAHSGEEDKKKEEPDYAAELEGFLASLSFLP
jgi:hypothetical protein